jgi:pyridoxine 5'-phosphate synthase PdxJ
VTPEDIANRFTYHPPDDARRVQHEDIRQLLLEDAQYLNANLPEGREKSLAITKLEEVMFWSNAAIARQQ